MVHFLFDWLKIIKKSTWTIKKPMINNQSFVSSILNKLKKINKERVTIHGLN